MSIEKDLTRIADALEALVGKLDHIGQATASVPEAPKPPSQGNVADVASTPVTIASTVAAPPSPPAAQATVVPTTPPPVNTPAVPAQATPPPVAMTPEDLNKALVAEFQRLGSRDPIDTVMRAAPFNAQSITDLTPDQYAPLIAAVQAVKA